MSSPLQEAFKQRLAASNCSVPLTPLPQAYLCSWDGVGVGVKGGQAGPVLEGVWAQVLSTGRGSDTHFALCGIGCLLE